MAAQLRIVFKGMDPSPAVAARVEERAAKLEQLFGRASKCRVTVEAPHRRRTQGKLFTVHLDITVPGDALAVSRSHRKDHAHEDVYVAIRDAFNAAARQLKEHARVRRGEVKTHRQMPKALAPKQAAQRGGLRRRATQRAGKGSAKARESEET